MLASALVILAGAASAAPADRAVSYLSSARNADGGWGGAPRTPSSAVFTAWSAIGLGAAGRTVTVATVAHLRADGRSATALGDVERTVIALRAAGSRPDAALRRKLVAGRRADGSFGGLVNLTAFGVLALRAAGRPATDASVRAGARFIAGAQHADGGYGFAVGGSSDVDDTGAALEALAAGGTSTSSAAVTGAVAYLGGAQRPDGGFGASTTSTTSNSQSTAFAVQGLVAAGFDPAQQRRETSPTPLQYLRARQDAAGAVRYSATGNQTPVWVTAQALAALARRPLPILR